MLCIALSRIRYVLPIHIKNETRVYDLSDRGFQMVFMGFTDEISHIEGVFSLRTDESVASEPTNYHVLNI